MTDTDTAHRKDNGPKARARSAKQVPAGPFANVLCAVDGTRASTAAVKMAAGLAGSGGHLTLLAVTAESGSGPNASAVISASRVNGVLKRAKAIAENAGVAATTVVDPGSPPVEIILERAADHDLLAIGAPVSSRLGGMFLGAIAAAAGGMRVAGVGVPALSRFTTPMLVVRAPFAGSLDGRRILVASDGDEDSHGIVELAGKLAVSQGAQVTLVNALGPESKMNPRAVQEQARELERMLPGASDTCIEPGKAWDVILKAAKSRKAALVVIGSRRLGGLRALGSVSRRVVHDAPCSVLLVPPDDD